MTLIYPIKNLPTFVIRSSLLHKKDRSIEITAITHGRKYVLQYKYNGV